MKYAILPFAVSALCAAASCAFADTPKLRGETFCFPAKDVPKRVGELAEVKPERRNIVDVRLKPRFIIKDQDVWPDSLIIEGGAYDLQPVPSPKTLRRFGMGDAENAE